jgi:hypothetical protein
MGRGGKLGDDDSARERCAKLTSIVIYLLPSMPMVNKVAAAQRSRSLASSEVMRVLQGLLESPAGEGEYNWE